MWTDFGIFNPQTGFTGDVAFGVKIQPDGKFVVAGQVAFHENLHLMGVARYNGDQATTTISPQSRFFSSTGGEGSVNVTSTGSWTAVSNTSWIEIASISWNNTNGTVDYVVRDNLTENQRTGTMTIAGHTFTVTQDGRSSGNCVYTISPSNVVVAAAGGGGSVQIITGSSCAWVATSNEAWITITSSTNGMGNGAVSYTVAANTTPSGRKAKITVAGKTFAIKQKGGS